MTENVKLVRLERLLEVSRNLSAALDHEPFLQSIIAIASELTDSEAASILVPDGDGKHLCFAALPWFHREVLQNLKVPLDESVAGWVITNRTAVIVPDASMEPRHFKQADKTARFQTRSILAVPIIYRGNAIGVIEAVNKSEQAHYTEEDINVLEVLAAQTALSLENASLESRVQASSGEAAQLDRMKSDFIAIASHELRTPLGLILGHATFLRENLPEEYHQQMDIIIRNAMRLKDIIDSIANMDNIQSGKASLRRRTVSIQRIVEDVLDTFYEEARRKKIDLTASFSRPDMVVEGEASKIAIALNNLVKNALTFTNSGGKILISAEQIPGYVKIAVSDDGIGIPARDLPHVFKRFYQAESHLTRSHGGMGLGLSVAKVMIEMHGGQIWVESVEGRGSKFSFLLPIDLGQADAASRVFES